MLKLEFRWWIWLIIALVIYMIWRGPSAVTFLVGGLWHLFADIGNAIVRGINGVRAAH